MVALLAPRQNARDKLFLLKLVRESRPVLQVGCNGCSCARRARPPRQCESRSLCLNPLSPPQTDRRPWMSKDLRASDSKTAAADFPVYDISGYFGNDFVKKNTQQCRRGKKRWVWLTKSAGLAGGKQCDGFSMPAEREIYEGVCQSDCRGEWSEWSSCLPDQDRLPDLTGKDGSKNFDRWIKNEVQKRKWSIKANAFNGGKECVTTDITAGALVKFTSSEDGKPRTVDETIPCDKKYWPYTTTTTPGPTTTTTTTTGPDPNGKNICQRMLCTVGIISAVLDIVRVTSEKISQDSQ